MCQGDLPNSPSYPHHTQPWLPDACLVRHWVSRKLGGGNINIFLDLLLEFQNIKIYDDDYDIEQETDIEGVRASAELVYKHIDVSDNIFVQMFLNDARKGR